MTVSLPGWTELRVIKLGGSLLEQPGVLSAFEDWRSLSSHCTTAESLDLLVVGGGRRVDEIRRSQSSLGWNDETCHWKSIEVMDRNSRCVAESLGWPVVPSLTELAQLNSEKAVVLVESFANWIDECSWAVTSDSLALEVYQAVANSGLIERKLNSQGGGLFLLKSADPPRHLISRCQVQSLPESQFVTRSQESLQQLAKSSYIDDYFPIHYGQSDTVCRVAFVNLRSRMKDLSQA